MLSKRITLIALFVLGGLTCGDDEPTDQPTPGELEIGLRNSDGEFIPVAEGEEMAIILGANGLNMVTPSLRAADINPSRPDPTVEVEVGGVLMAADIEGSRVDMQSDGTGYVLWDLRVPFQTDLCCYNCRTGTLTAHVEDASGQLFEGSVTVLLERGGCPNPAVCCANADACPDPSTTQVCE